MSYQVLILRSAQKSLGALPKIDYEKVRDAITALSLDPRPRGCKKLVGREGWRIRVGKYRVIYQIDDSLLVVTVLRIAHRREAY